MPAVMVDLVPKCKAPGCDRIAHVEVRDAAGVSHGTYCFRHGQALVAKLNADEAPPNGVPPVDLEKDGPDGP